jgi:hypothetical protein
MSERTGELVRALADGVGADLAEIVQDIDAVRGRLLVLAEHAVAINGLAVSSNGWADRLATMAQEITKEANEVQAKLLGKRKVEVLTHVNPAWRESA